jgi:hypothetical protein
MVKKGKNSGNKQAARGSSNTNVARTKKRAMYSNVNSSSGKLAVPHPESSPDFPREQCFRSCRSEPFSGAAACKELGLDLAACRSPTNGRPSVTRRDLFTLRCSADATDGQLDFRVRPTLEGTIEVLKGSVGGVSGASDYSGTVDHPALSEIQGAFSTYRMIGAGFKIETTQSFTTNEGIGFVGQEYPFSGYPRDAAADFDGDYVMSLPGAISVPMKQGLTSTVPITGTSVSIETSTTDSIYSRVAVDPNDWISGTITWDTHMGPAGGFYFLGDLISASAVALEGLETSATFDLIVCVVWEGTPKSKFQPIKQPVSPVHTSNAVDVHRKKKHHAKKSWISNDLIGKASDIFGDIWGGARGLVNVAGKIPISADVAAVVGDVMDGLESGYDVFDMVV